MWNRQDCNWPGVSTSYNCNCGRDANHTALLHYLSTVINDSILHRLHQPTPPNMGIPLQSLAALGSSDCAGPIVALCAYGQVLTVLAYIFLYPFSECSYSPVDVHCAYLIWDSRLGLSKISDWHVFHHSHVNMLCEQ